MAAMAEEGRTAGARAADMEARGMEVVARAAKTVAVAMVVIVTVVATLVGDVAHASAPMESE